MARWRGLFGAHRFVGLVVVPLLVGGVALAGAVSVPLPEEVDTELTPVAKETDKWEALGGARYNKGGALFNDADSPTSHTIDFFSVAFSPPDPLGLGDQGGAVGLFGGAECINPNTPFEDVSDDPARDCIRRPAIYRYSTDEVGQQRIERCGPGPSAACSLPIDPGKSGFVGAVAWIDAHRALAVGGTGAYPRRERPAVPGGDEAYAQDDVDHGAGLARAWLYENGAWTELTTLPDGMRALTTVACAPLDKPPYGTPESLAPGVCVAGGMQQLWWWRPAAADRLEGFDESPTTPADVRDTSGAPDFHLRVRQIRFNPDYGASGDARIVAVTSGCCVALDPLSDTDTPGGGRLLSFVGFGDQTKWVSEQLRTGEDAAAGAASSLPDSYYGLVYTGGGTITNGGGLQQGLSVVAAPGGPLEDQALTDEPGSRILQPTAGAPDITGSIVQLDPADRKLDDLRLLSGDGDFGGTLAPADAATGTTSQPPDGMLDWAVGSFKGSNQAVAYTTIPGEAMLPQPLSCTSPADDLLASDVPDCQPRPENVSPDVLDSRRLVVLPLHTLNALSFVPDGTGVAWAAGDRGALARLGGAGRLGAGADPVVAQLGTPEASKVTDHAPFDAFRPPVTTPGVVPALLTQPMEQLDEPQLVPYGTSDPTRWEGLRREAISSIAMSRDGTEGWSVGPGNPYSATSDGTGPGDMLALQHFNGERWIRCDIDGLGGAYEPDAACERLHPLLERRANNKVVPPALAAVARIPLERDDDPSNDDEFAAIAVGTALTDALQDAPAVVLGYRDGRWQLDSEQAEAVRTSGIPVGQIAFRTPGDGWLASMPSNSSRQVVLYHYGGGDWPNGRWVACSGATPPPECGEGITAMPITTGGRNIMVQVAGDTTFVSGMRLVGTTTYPFVMSKTPDGPWVREYDPGCPTPECAGDGVNTGEVWSMSVVDVGDGKIAGWLVGHIGGTGLESDDNTRALGPTHVLMRRDPNTGTWAFRDTGDAAGQYLSPIDRGRIREGLSFIPTSAPKLVSFRADNGGERSFLLPSHQSRDGDPDFPPLEYDVVADRWKVISAPFVSNRKPSRAEQATTGIVTAAAADGRGGIWVAGKQALAQGFSGDNVPRHGTFYYRYSSEGRRAVFEPSPMPVVLDGDRRPVPTAPISGLTGSADGTVWMATESDNVYRYDRLTGWQNLRIKGWDPGRIVTRASKAFAIAVNDAGDGVVVGEQGRIADISAYGVMLDPASARSCATAAPPCVSPQDLRAATVGPDGSVMVGGDQMALMWRDAGGAFGTIDRPRVSLRTQVTGLSMPSPGRAWLTTSAGEIWAGGLTGGRWRWIRESGGPAAADERRNESYPNGRARLNAVAVDAGGSGLAVGDRGAMLERSPDGTWTRLGAGYFDNFYSVALPPSGYGDGVLVGGGIGLILTRTQGAFHVARPSDITDPVTVGPGQPNAARILGFALSGGPEPGDVEAWAASQVPPDPPAGGGRTPAPSALLHYAGGSSALLRPQARAEPLDDTAPAKAGEVTLAAFGRSECQLEHYCPEFHGSRLFNEVVNDRIKDELRTRHANAVGPMAALFTGDIGAMPGRGQRGERTVVGVPGLPTAPNVVQDRWRELIVEPLMAAGVPTFAALGKTDLSRVTDCPDDSNCPDTQEYVDAGVSQQWRASFAGMPAPWGNGPVVRDGEIAFEPVEDESSASVEAPGGGARTHYAIDVMADGEPLARLVFIDNSFARSLTTGEASQNPIEGQGGQVAWLERMICVDGSVDDAGVEAVRDCSRGRDVPAIVVMNAPTYSYGPGGLDSTMQDGSAFETLLVKHNVTAVIAGRLGWNGLFYTLAPGLHSPCPGDGYPQGPPSVADARCGGVQTGSGVPETPEVAAAGEVAGAMRGLGAPLPPQAEAELGAAEGLTRAIPNVVAASAGGRFGPRGDEFDGAANDGFWHGYSIIRVRPARDGRPPQVIVEQRPIFDWIGITASEHTLRPGQKLSLRGFGREPIGTDTSVRLDDITADSGITHRWDLLEADQTQPWVPKVVEGNGNPHGYVPLDPGVGTIDPATGRVIAQRAAHGRVFGLAVLSVGDQAASWPISFEPKRSYTSKALRVVTPPAVPEVRVLGFNAQALSTPPGAPPATTPPPINTTLNVPGPPAIPSSPTVTPGAAPPIAPPAPPAPPASQQASGLDLSIAPVGVAVPPTTGVTAQPTPPVNPSPPSGARKEAKQRQAATAKSEEGSSGPSEQRVSIDGTGSPPGAEGAAYTRRDRVRPAADGFTPLSRPHAQPSAWTTGLEWGGGIGLLAMALALGFTTARPTPRRRPPLAPAPAWARRKR